MSGITSKLLARNKQLLAAIIQRPVSNPGTENSNRKLLRPGSVGQFSLGSTIALDQSESFDDEQGWDYAKRPPHSEINTTETVMAGTPVQRDQSKTGRAQFSEASHRELVDSKSGRPMSLPVTGLDVSTDTRNIDKEIDHPRVQRVEASHTTQKAEDDHSGTSTASKTVSDSGTENTVQSHLDTGVDAISEIQPSELSYTSFEKDAEIFKSQLSQIRGEGAQENQRYRDELEKLRNDGLRSLSDLKNKTVTARNQKLMPDTKLQAMQVQTRSQRAGANISIGSINVEVIEPNTTVTAQTRPRSNSGHSNKSTQRRSSSRNAGRSYFGLGQL